MFVVISEKFVNDFDSNIDFIELKNMIKNMKVKKLKLKKWVCLKLIIEICEVYDDGKVDDELFFDSVDMMYEMLWLFLLIKGKKIKGIKKKWKFFIIIFFKVKFEFLEVIL